MSGRIFSGERVARIEDVMDRSARAASGLLATGVGPNDAIALLLRNDFPLFEASYAAAMIGASSVPINWHFGAEEVGYILTDSAAKALVVHADLYHAIADSIPDGTLVLVAETPPEIAAVYSIAAERCAPPQGKAEWGAWLRQYEALDQGSKTPNLTSIVYTSGSTGKPKGVRRILDSDDIAARASAAVDRLYDVRPDARTAVTGPMYHSALNAYGLKMAAAGADVWLMPRFDARGLLELIDREKLTHLHLVPIMFTRMLKLPDDERLSFDVSSLRHVAHGAAPCPIEVKQRMIDWWGPIINEYFGSTETRMIAACNSEEWLAHPGTVGRILEDTDVEIVDEEGRVLPLGTPGEIYAWNHAVEDFTYTGDSAKRASVERNGLITAGDVGYVDEDGFLFLCDRRRDMINSGGVNIYPIEIEASILEMKQIRDCAVFGIPDPEYGESIAAAIELHPGEQLTAEAVQDHVRTRLARYKTPKLVEFHDTLPREDSGKIFKQQLRAPHWRKAGRSI